jgi:hypothetical protein
MARVGKYKQTISWMIINHHGRKESDKFAVEGRSREFPGAKVA